MSAYVSNSIDSDNYQRNRVTYPKTLYDAILRYHRGGRKLAVDVGCGTGIGSFPLLNYFEKVVGCDPSSKMLQTAEAVKQKAYDGEKNRIEFVEASGEELSSNFEDHSVDLVCGGESIQYTRLETFFEQVHKILKPGGTLSYWFYCDPIFIDYPMANRIFKHYVYEDERGFGSVWPPEMKYVKELGANIEIPSDMFEDVEREIYIPLKDVRSGNFLLDRNDYTLNDLRKNMSTWGVYQLWLKRNKDCMTDIIDLVVDKIKSECGISVDLPLRVQWETAFYVARNRK